MMFILPVLPDLHHNLLSQTLLADLSNADLRRRTSASYIWRLMAALDLTR